MDIKQLQALLAIADHGSFSAAARALATVQSNISGHVGRLEGELRATLVDRQSGRLTDEGELVATRARRILHEMEDIEADIASLGDQVEGDARIGSIGTTARWLMPRVLPAVGRDHPGIRMTVHDGATSSLLQRVAAAEIDAAVVHVPADAADLDVTALFAEDLLLLAHTKHALAERDMVSITELAAHQVLLAPAGSALRRTVDRAAASRGVKLRPQAEIDGVRLLASLAFEGFGPAIVPASAVPGWLRGDFVRIAVPELPRRKVGWVQRRRPRPNMATLAVAQVIRDVVARHGARTPGVHPEI